MQWILTGIGYGLLAGGWVLGFGVISIFVGSFLYWLYLLAERLLGRGDGDEAGDGD